MTLKDKTIEELLDMLEAYTEIADQERIKMAIQNLLVNQLGSAISRADTDMIAQSGHLARTIDQFRQSTDKSSKIMARLTAAIVFLTAVSAVIFYLQRSVMQGQLDVMTKQLGEMQSAGKQTDKLIQEAVKQSQAVREGANAAQKTIEVTQENIRLDQRAWVGQVDVKPPDIKAGSEIIFEVKFANSGKTPAHNFKALISRDLVSSDQKFAPHYRNVFYGSTMTLQPGEMKASLKTFPIILAQTDIDAMKNGTRKLYIYGKFSYEDVFKHLWHGTFCMYVEPSLTDITFCDTGN
jgi:hypothetical protein